MAETNAGSSPNARFLSDGTPAGRRGPSRYGGAMAASMASHAAGLLLVVSVIARLPAGTMASRATDHQPNVVWLTAGHGGNIGGGSHSTTPARRVEAPGQDRMTVPAPPSVEPALARHEATPTPPAPFVVPALPAASGLEQAVGVVSDLPSIPSNSLGPGTKGGAGAGNGGKNGDGDGTKPGAGDGCCEGVFVTGIDIVPRLIQEVKPGYTTEAMRAKVQGVVVLEAVVLPDGSVGTVRIVRSLDPNGLDKEAVKTVKLWRFSPGRKDGKPVASLVQVDMAFTLR